MTRDEGIQYQALPFTQKNATSVEEKVRSDVWWDRLQFPPVFRLSTNRLGNRVTVALSFRSFRMEMKTTAKPTDNTSDVYGQVQQQHI
jgi:hypothetical protein